MTSIITKPDSAQPKAEMAVQLFGDWFDPIEISKHLTFNHDYPEVDGDVHFRAKIVMQDLIGSSTRFVAKQRRLQAKRAARAS